jgi:cation transport ATPase
MSPEEFSELRRENLTEEAKLIYDKEVKRRKSVALRASHKTAEAEETSNANLMQRLLYSCLLSAGASVAAISIGVLGSVGPAFRVFGVVVVLVMIFSFVAFLGFSRTLAKRIKKHAFVPVFLSLFLFPIGTVLAYLYMRGAWKEARGR